MNNFWTRTLTGIVFTTVVICCIWWSFWSMAALFLVISVLGLYEFYKLIEQTEIKPQKWIGVFLGAVMFCVYSYWTYKSFVFSIFALYFFSPVIIIIFIVELFRRSSTPLHNIAFTLLGLTYVIVPFSLLNILSMKSNPIGFLDFSYSANKLLGFFFLIWSNDTFAYLVGKTIGKRKLFERISPKKTWEGFIGGIICTQGIAYIISLYFSELTMMQWMIVAAIVSVTGTLGDLVESMLKRSLGVKDSGNIFPGHGGILDRFDGVLLSSPFVVAYLMLIR